MKQVFHDERMIQIKTIEEYIEEKNDIIRNKNLSDKEILDQLYRLFSDMAVDYSIPLKYSVSFKSKNRETVEAFEEIRDEIKSRQILH